MEAIEKIREHLSENGITQSKLAELSGLSFGTVNRILNRKQELYPNTLKKLADALNLSVTDLEEENRSFNYAVQGYLQFGKEIEHITSFQQLKNWIKKFEPLITELPNKAKAIQREEAHNKKKIKQSCIKKEDIDFYKSETIDASKVETWSFRKAEDERDGLDIDLGNMCVSYPFSINGHTFTNSEALYICGLFSNDTPKHKQIQEKLLFAKSGYDAKKSVRTKYEDSFAREDWETFNVEWMKWCVWQKITGSDDFRKTLSDIPQDAYIIENSTHQKGKTATFWGMKNPELEEKRDIVEECAKYDYPSIKKKDLTIKTMEARNQLNHIGIWHGINCMGKILKYLQLCLIDGSEPQINYDLLREKKIYLFGELLTFRDNVSLYILYD